MNAILSSKLYKISSRKDKIASAMKNPINVELVKQLDSYIDQPEDVSDALEEETVDEVVDTEADGVKRDESAEIVNDKSATFTRPSESKADSDVSDRPIVEVEQKESEEPEDDSEDKESEDNPLNKFHKPRSKDDENSEDVEESTQITETPVVASQVKASCCDYVRIDAEILKGTLNSREDTKGVSRITKKEDELWIFYQDKVNLNSIMEPVIELMNASDFSYLEFNRLARSSNAIVFDISCTPDEVEPIKNEE